jgi:hypothetical protein
MWGSNGALFARAGRLPIVEDCRYVSPDSLPCRVAIRILRQQLVIIGMDMPDMGNHSKADHLWAELFGSGGAAHTAAVLAACMFGNLDFFFRGTPRILLADRAGERGDKLMILRGFYPTRQNRESGSGSVRDVSRGAGDRGCSDRSPPVKPSRTNHGAIRRAAGRIGTSGFRSDRRRTTRRMKSPPRTRACDIERSDRTRPSRERAVSSSNQLKK